ncbi:quinol:cytochrome C oxidoreductase [Flammeovirga sp. EKP202]|uniref:quinol:cytochrome C oxidoreductase n=1 Tax=Flammeovirga sp. EKP202 TaxID=2770592 RepID=UPI00165F6981|nr:quinol:cytochrome C oxidoreductase [Flammeovirga sp. EKP202]MBD0401852.1 quinol:cytochrome C oxidoreductase [Flammeovirga sp. EKP202]
MAHVDVDLKNVQEQFTFDGKLKKNVLLIGGIGVVLFVLGAIFLMMGGGHDDHHAAVQHATEVASVASDGAHGDAHGGGHHGEFHWYQRIIVDFWMSGVFFTGVALLGFFFFALQYVANSGWPTLIMRVMLNFRQFIPVGGIVLLITFLVGSHTIFHWTHDGIADPNSPTYDAIIAGKTDFLNVPFFLFRMVLFVTIWTFFGFILNKVTKAEDQDMSGTTKYFRKAQRLSVAFLIFFGISESITSWDWIMSIDTHWFSTLFGWYILAGWLVTAVAFMSLFVLILQDMGYLKLVNENHLHDLGKFLFGFSIFWSYLWFSQFLLIYYANIPEETVYFIDRLKSDTYAPLFFGILVTNFLFPFFVLMTRDAKRKTIMMKIVAVVVIFGHFMEYCLLIVPGSLKENGGFGLTEIGTGMIFLSIFLYLYFTGLSKGGLIPQNHPMLEESVHHHT